MQTDGIGVCVCGVSWHIMDDAGWHRGRERVSECLGTDNAVGIRLMASRSHSVCVWCFPVVVFCGRVNLPPPLDARNTAVFFPHNGENDNDTAPYCTLFLFVGLEFFLRPTPAHLLRILST